MIRLMEDMPAGTVGVEAVGRVTGDDYRNVLVPAISDALERKNVRLLYLLGPQFKSYTASGMWADTKLWGMNPRAWKKVALVSESGWIEKTVKTLARLMPGRVKTFELDELDDAKAWVS
jgi:stage II sporulation SpoAA-like protein